MESRAASGIEMMLLAQQGVRTGVVGVDGGFGSCKSPKHAVVLVVARGALSLFGGDILSAFATHRQDSGWTYGLMVTITMQKSNEYVSKLHVACRYLDMSNAYLTCTSLRWRSCSSLITKVTTMIAKSLRMNGTWPSSNQSKKRPKNNNSPCRERAAVYGNPLPSAGGVRLPSILRLAA